MKMVCVPNCLQLHVGERKADKHRCVKKKKQTTFKYFVNIMEKESFKIMSVSGLQTIIKCFFPIRRGACSFQVAKCRGAVCAAMVRRSGRMGRQENDRSKRPKGSILPVGFYFTFFLLHSF